MAVLRGGRQIDRSRADGVVTIGLGLGLVGAIVVSRVFGDLLYDVRPQDPMTLGGVTPARCGRTGGGLHAGSSGSGVDPVLALRAE